MTDGAILTKSDFLEFNNCTKAFWLHRHKPDAIEWPAPSDFDRMLMADGYAVESKMHQLVEGWGNAEDFRFQQSYRSEDGLSARTDLVRLLEDGRIDFYEVKSSTSLKSQIGDHIADAAFQLIAIERSGVQVRSIYITHVDKTYIREGVIDPNRLLKTVDVSDEVRKRSKDIEPAVEEALAMLELSSIEEQGCDCRFKGTVTNHCAAFEYFNPDMPEQSIYLLPRLSALKTELFAREGRFSLDEIDDIEVTAGQLPVLRAAKGRTPVINKEGISTFLEGLEWPLYFYDYETFKSAIPVANGVRAHQQIPVQVSIHKLGADGSLDHSEFLCSEAEQREQMVGHLSEYIGQEGKLVSWNESFEMTCNKDMAAQFARYERFLLEVNDRTVDLMDVFKKDYVDIRFKGSTSIKKVLPVICPNMTYDDMAVSDGASAMAAWLAMAEEQNPEIKKQMAQDLLEYCKLDTLAMVEIYRFLTDLVNQYS